MSFVDIKKVNKYYDNFHILKDLSLSVNKGEFVVFLGPSGSGKSTLLRVIAGLEQIKSGSVILDGEDITTKAPYKRNVSMVFQSYALYPHMNVEKNISYGLKNLGVPKEEIETRVSDVADMLEIKDYLNRKPQALSGGQRQRVAIGRAVVHKPKLFLFDEPLSNLDAKLRIKMRYEIKKLHTNLKITSIYVTHDQIEAMTMGDKILLINEGKVMQYGTPEELYNHPVNIFVADFIGAPSMNMFETSIKNNTLQTECESIKIKLKNCEAIKNKNIILGIRGEHLSINKHNTEKDLSFNLKVSMLENLGPHAHMYLEIPSSKDPINVRIDSRDKKRVNIGEQTNIYVDANSMYLFDKETEMFIGFLEEFI